jgi:WxcM-like, C-terminal.
MKLSTPPVNVDLASLQQRHSFIDLVPVIDNRGSLVSLEAMKQVPFDIKRIFYIFHNTDGENRGFHAHRSDQQFLICMAGKVLVRLYDGKFTNEYWLDHPSKGLLVKSMAWLEMYEFSPDCSLVVLSSEHYNEKDYIRDYDAFLEGA